MSMFGLTRSRQRWFLLTLLVSFFVLNTASMMTMAPRVARAQAEGGEAPAAAAAGGEDKAPKQTKSVFIWFLESSGFIGVVILVLSIYFVSTVSRSVHRNAAPSGGPARDRRRNRGHAAEAAVQGNLRSGERRQFDLQPAWCPPESPNLPNGLGRSSRSDGNGRRVDRRRNGTAKSACSPCSARWGR